MMTLSTPQSKCNIDLNNQSIVLNETLKNQKQQKSFNKFFTGILILLFILVNNGYAQTYSTAGSYQWTCPAGVTSVQVQCWGAGGGGAGASSSGNLYVAGGGAGGNYSKATISVTPGTVYTVVVGAGGTGGSTNSTTGYGADGGTSSFATSLYASGGCGGWGGGAVIKAGLGGVNSGVKYTTVTAAGTYSAAPTTVTFGTAWAANTAYTLNQQISAANGKLYTVTVAGTSGSTTPTHTTGSATNGSATLTYAGVAATGSIGTSGSSPSIVVSYISITNPGSGYLTAPSVNISGGTATTAATATATINAVNVTGASVYYLGGNGANGAYIASCTSNVSGAGGSSAGTGSNGNNATNASATTNVCSTAVFTASAFGAAVTGGGAGAAGVTTTATNGTNASELGGGGSGAVGSAKTGGAGYQGQVIITYPTISNSGTLLAFSTASGTASTSQSFTVSGTNMFASITVTAPTGFEVSSDNSNFSNSITVGAAGTISSTTVYVRLTAAASVGSYNGLNIGLSSSGISTVNVSIPNSTVNSAAVPAVSLSTTSLGTILGANSTEKSFSVAAIFISTNDITITAPTNFQVSTTSGSGFSSSVTLTPVDGSVSTTNIYIRFTPTGSGSNSGNITVSCSSVSNQTVSVSGTLGQFYYQSGSLNSLSSWTSGADGTGISPLDFTTDGVTYSILKNVTTDAAWTISGTGSKIMLGDPANAAVSLTIDSLYPITGTIDLAAASSGSNNLILKSSTYPTFGTLNAGSTVTYAGSRLTIASTPTYGNLAVTNIYDSVFLASNITVKDLTISGAGLLSIDNVVGASGKSLTIQGNVNLSGTGGIISRLNSGNNNTLVLSGTSKTITNTASGNNLSKTNITISGSYALNSNFDFVTLTNARTISGAGSLDISNYTLNLNYGNTTLSTITTNASSVIKTSEKSTLAPIPSGRTWNGLVEYAWPSGLQSVVAGTYNDLKLSNTSGADTVRGNIIVNGTLTTTSGGTLDLGTYSLSGTLGTIANAGTIKTSNLSSAPITSGKTWGGTINYASVNGGQSIVGGTFNNLTLLNTSGTDSAKSDIVVNGTLTTTEGGTFDMSTYALSGTLATLTNNGYLKTSNVSSTPLTTGKTWLGTVEFGGSSVIIPSATSYNNVVITSSLLNVSSNPTINGNLTISGTGKMIGENSTLTRSVNIGGNLLVSGTGGITNTGGGQSFSFTLSGTGKTYTNTATNNNMNKTNFNITGSYALGSDITWVGAIASRYIGGSGSLDISGYTLDMGLGYLATSTIITNASSVIKTACPISQTNTPIPTGKTWNGTVRFTAATGLQAIPAGTYTNLQIDNTSGADSLRGDVTVNGVLALTSGILATSSYKLVAAGSTTRTTGWVNGNLQKPVSASGVVLFEVGDASVYSPASLNFNTVTTGGSLIVSTKKGIASQSAINSIGLNASNAVNRYFTLAAQDGLDANYSGTYSFSNPSDILGTVTNSNLLSAINTSGNTWNYGGKVTASTSTSVTTANSSAFGDVVFVSPISITVTADAKVKNLGASDPVFTYTVTSGSLNAGDAFTGSLSRTSGDTAGIYSIQKGTLSISPNTDNYSINFVSANLVILNSDPIITVSNSSLPAFSALANGAVSSSPQSFSLLGANLGANNIVITAPRNFIISLSSYGNFTDSITISPIGGAVSSTNIYVKYAPTGNGAFTGNVNVSCAANNITISNPNVSVSGYQNIYYYTGTGVLSSLSSWSGTLNGTGTSNPSNFSTAGVTYKILSNVATTESWGVTGTGSKIVLGDSTLPADTLTIASGFPITSVIDVSDASSGANTIIVKDAALPSLGTLAASSELHIQGNTTINSATPQLGNLFVDGVNNTLSLATGSNLTIQSSLTVASGSTMYSQGTTSIYTLIKSGGIVTINGNYKTSKSAGLVGFNVGSGSTSLPSIQFVDVENPGVNFVLGTSSTIEYSRDASGTTQNITARSDYNNLIVSGNDNNKSINGPTVVAGTFTVTKTTGPSLNTILGTVRVNGSLVLGDTLKRATFITFGNGSTINRSTGFLDSLPSFAGSVNMIYSGSAALTTGLECPSYTQSINNFTVSNSAGVSLNESKSINGTLTLTTGALIVGNKTLSLLGNPISVGSGSLTTDSTSSIVFGGNNAGPFALPSSVTSLNNLTINNINANPVVLTTGNSLTVKGQLDINDDSLALGANSLTINGSPILGSGGITSSASSNLSFGGNNAGPFNIPSGISRLNSLTINNSNATPATVNVNTALTLAGSVNLTSGVLNDNGNVISFGGNITGTGSHIGSGKLRLTGTSKTISAARIKNIEVSTGASVSISSLILSGTLEMNGSSFTVDDFNNTKFLNGSTIIRNSNGPFNLSGGTYTFGDSATDVVNLIIRNNMTTSGEWSSSPTPGKIGSITIDSSYTYTIGSSASREATTLTINGTLADNGATVNVKSDITGSGNHTGTGKISVNNNNDTSNISGVTFNNLEINNTGNGIAIINSNITVNGNLVLTYGTLKVGDDSLTINGIISSGTNGKLSTDSTSTVIFSGSSADAFNLPSSMNTLRNFTVNKTAANPVKVSLTGSLRVDGNFNTSDDTLSIGANTLTLNGAPVSVNSKLLTTSASNLVFGGSNVGPFDIPSSVAALNSLTINNTNAVPATLKANSAFTTAGALNIMKGTFNDNGNIITVAGNITGDSGIHIGSGKIVMTGSGKNIYAKRINNIEFASNASISNFGSTVYGTLTMNGGNVTINAQNNIANVLTMANGSSIVRYSGNLSLSGGTFYVGSSATDSMSLIIRGNLTSSAEFPGGSGNPGRIKQLTIDSGYTYTTTVSGKGIVNLTLNGTLADGGSTITVRGNINGQGNHTGSGRILIANNTLSSIISRVTLNNLELNNAAGCNITNDLTLNGKLYLTSGVFNTKSNKLFVRDSVIRTSGWVYGNLQRSIPSVGVYNFDLGDSAINYTPASINITTLTNAGSLLAAAKTGLASQSAYASLGLNTSKALNRYFKLSKTDSLSASYIGTYSFVPNDTIGNPVYSDLITAINDSASNWNYVGKVTSSSSTTVTAASSSKFGDVVFASQKTITVTANQMSKNLGDADPVLTYSVSGSLADGDVITGNLTRAAGETGGIYPIQQGSLTVTPNSGNYIINFIPADFVVLSEVNPITSFNATHTSNNIIRLSWNEPIGEYSKVLIFARPVTANHVPSGIGVQYDDANSNITSAGTYSSDNYLVYAGNGTNVEITGLTNGTNYNFVAYTYNGISYSSVSSINATAILNPTTALAATAGFQQTTLNWVNPTYYANQSNYWDEVIVIAKATAEVDITPSGDASAYTANAAFGLGSNLGGGNYVVYKGTGNTVTINGFVNTNQAYYYKTFVRHGLVWSASQSILAYPIQAGDYSYKNSGGTWGTLSSAASNWNVWNGTAWVTASVLPTSNNNVLIFNNQTVTSNSSSSKLNYCKNISIDSGGTLKSGTVGSAIYVSVFGNSILVKSGAMVGTNATGNSADGISFALCNSNITLYGGGTINLSRFRNDTTNVNLVINNDVLLNYHGAQYGGNAGAYHSNSVSGLGSHSLTVSAGKTLTFAPWACITPVSSAHVNAVSSLTLNINGTMTFVDGQVSGNAAANGWTGHSNGYINMGSSSTSPSAINIGSTGVLNVSELYPNGTASDNSAGTGVVIDMNVAAGGQLNVSKIADFRNPSQKVVGGGIFNIMNGATLKIGSPSGITKTDVNETTAGQIITNNRIFNNGANYSYEGASSQVTGVGLPDSISALTINNTSGVSLTNNVKVNDSLNLTNGVLITNNYVVTSMSNVVKYNGWVAGNLQKYFATGAVSKTFETGDLSNYRPVSLAFGNVTSAGLIKASVTQAAGAHPNQSTSMISSTKRLNRYWTLTNNGVVFNNYNATFNFVSTDILNNANTSSFIGSNFNSNSWAVKSAGTKTSTSTQLTNLTTFGDFLIGESCITPIVSNVVACDSYTFNGVTYTTSTNVTFYGTNADGCDSSYNLVLTINKSSASTENINTCDSYTWHGTTYLSSITTSWTGVNAKGCDSVVTLNLTINNSSSYVQNVVVCDSFNWHGVTYTQSTNLGAYSSNIVNTKEGLVAAFAAANPGDTIIVANGKYNWGNIKVDNTKGNSSSAWIVLKAQSLNGVTFVGNTYLQFAGNRIHVTGFKFAGGNAGTNAVVAFRTSTSTLANYSRISNITVDNYNTPNPDTENEWVAFYGVNNRMDHCSFINKSNARATVVVWYSTATFPDKSISTYHRIDSNYFSGRSYMGGNGGETIRVGVGNNSRTDGYNIIENNLFENCTQTEPEIVSNKSCRNTYRYNTFKNCNGGLTLRMGKYCDVYGNSFIVNDSTKTGSYGIRIIDKGHRVFNNYMEGLLGTSSDLAAMRSPIVIYNGHYSTADSLNPLILEGTYIPADDALVAFNTIVNCKGTGMNIGYTDNGGNTYVPTGLKIANNVIKMAAGQAVYSDTSNSALSFVSEGNIYDAPTGLGISSTTGFSSTSMTLSSRNNGILSPGTSAIQDKAVNTSSYSTLLNGLDLQGQLRSATYDVGCDELNGTGSVINKPLDSSLVGGGKTTFNNQNSFTSMLPKWIGTNAAGCDSIVYLDLTVIKTCKTNLSVKAYLEGFYNGVGSMVASLYEIEPRISSDATATDSVTICLWSPDSLSNNTPSYSTKSIIHKNGIISLTLPNYTYNKPYYVSIKHRNSIETWSKNPVNMPGGTYSYDFTTGLDKAFGDGTNAPMKHMGNGVYAIYGGDVNNDGTADATDLQITENDAYNFFFGYNPSDCTGDGASDASDMQLIENNANLFLFMARPY